MQALPEQLPRLILLGGAPGIGKSTAARALYQELNNSIWLDVDDLWRSHPFRVDEATRAMVEQNTGCVVRNFLTAGYQHIIVTWVWHRQEVIDRLLGSLEGLAFDPKVVHLTADETALRARWEGDPNRGVVTDLALDRLKQCSVIQSVQVDVTLLSPSEVVTALSRIVE